MPEGVPLGPPVDARLALRPERQTIEGRYVTLVPLDTAHAPALYEHLCEPSNSAVWTYMPVENENFTSLSRFTEHIAQLSVSEDPFFYALIPKQDLPSDGAAGTVKAKAGRPVGYLSYLNIEPAHRCTEIGWVTFSPALQRTTAATEALALVMQHAFEELRNRRVEWKCDALNAKSRRAAERLGFVYEGLFRKHRIVHGRSRDTAWFSVVDDDWEEGKVGAALEMWLDPGNFTDGRQVRTLEQVRQELRGGQ
ncbi:hypothetical protein DL766_009910 [Monosporascus sp. MC13-8B]|uniref:N-acetyltransferase domain-containing protein n=1 Tax=Monosporascus cannonballus TaxID=155416 RepID=A0ABY0GT89_9PEZI|nr:hypothetical protein DL762_009490 [Monosporascus cannonballus]RYO96773.1 hypothetical protein DL763_003049 [Monosporascus cannonballus]RYP12826.1 hypothetical protein DL766_009910 [Monosporascus sp. MC13-8B]